MIIWIDGTYGIGKTNTAIKIFEKIKDKKIELLKSDDYYYEIIKRKEYCGGGTMPQNNRSFLEEFRKIIEEKISDSSKLIIIDMAITEKESKEYLIDYFSDKYDNMFHFILNDTVDNIKKRINNDKYRDKEHSLYFLANNITFLKNNFYNAIWIDTNNKDIDEVAEEIIEHIKNS